MKMTCTGWCRSLLLASPSCARPLQPQVQTVPSDFSAALWQSPPHNEVTARKAGACG